MLLVEIVDVAPVICVKKGGNGVGLCNIIGGDGVLLLKMELMDHVTL